MARFILSGFADEAADGLAGQIEATKALGWSWIEARSIDGKNIHDLSEEAFDGVRRQLDAAGVGINCFGSTIANWGKDVGEDFRTTMATVGRAIRRMKILGTPMVRIMSYALYLDPQGRLLPDQKKDLRIARLREICAAFNAEGITPVHENCLNYGGIGWKRTLELLDEVPGLKLVFDTGNPCLTPDFEKVYPYPNQDAMEAWRRLKSHVVHLHVKDGVRDVETGKETYVFPGEGPCRVEEILQDCAASGYSGWLSIEPHMAVVFHDVDVHSPAEARRENYVEYGRRVEAMLRRIGLGVKDGAAE